MNTIELTPVEYTLGSVYTDNDFVDTQHISNMIMDRVNKQTTILGGHHIYSLTLSIKPTRVDYHSFSLDELNDVSRRLTNGMSSLGMVSNRKFWNEHFVCGVRTTSISDGGVVDYPTFTLNYVLCGREDNLDVRLIKQLTLRIKMIDPRLKFDFQYIGQFSPELFCSSINYVTDVDYNNPTLQKLGENVMDEIFHNQFQRPRFLGGLYKLNPSTI
jgi:hypothetical protein